MYGVQRPPNQPWSAEEGRINASPERLFRHMSTEEEAAGPADAAPALSAHRARTAGLFVGLALVMALASLVAGFSLRANRAERGAPVQLDPAAQRRRAIDVAKDEANRAFLVPRFSADPSLLVGSGERAAVERQAAHVPNAGDRADDEADRMDDAARHDVRDERLEKSVPADRGRRVTPTATMATRRSAKSVPPPRPRSSSTGASVSSRKSEVLPEDPDSTLAPSIQ